MHKLLAAALQPRYNGNYMKRTISTIVLFVLLILTVVAITQIGEPKETHALNPDGTVARQQTQ